jgi:TrmH family RNA methyltransferase
MLACHALPGDPHGLKNHRRLLDGMLTVILVRPENAGNVGAVARCMANFGFDRLILLDPRCDITGTEAIGRAMHGRHVLESCTIVKRWEDLPCDTLIGTTAKLGTDYNIPRTPLTPAQLAENLAPAIGKRKPDAGLVLGPEGTGLTNEELRRCDFTVTIPATRKYPTLNVSHAAAIILHEIFQRAAEETHSSHIRLATDIEKRKILELLEDALKVVPFANEDKRDTQRLIWRRIITKAFLTKREAFALMGFLRKVPGRKR